MVGHLVRMMGDSMVEKMVSCNDLRCDWDIEQVVRICSNILGFIFVEPMKYM